MIALNHLFVLIASPAIVFGIAAYAVVRRDFLLGALASFGAIIVCGLVALRMFDGHLLAYNLIYSFLLAVPAMLAIVAIVSGARHVWSYSMRQYRKALGSNDGQ